MSQNQEEYPTVANYLTYCIKSKLPVCFLKFGDGEYQCVSGFSGGNCDGDQYNEKLKNGIIESFKYLTKFQTTLIGAWHTKEIVDFWNSLVPSQHINWVNYHTIIIDKKDIEDKSTGELTKKLEFFTAIKNSPLNKIIVCNELLEKAQLLFDADTMVYVPLRNWFQTKKNEIIDKIVSAMNDGTNIIIFSAGMSSKVIIYELHKRFPQNIYLDFGSALDLICTKRDSRGRGYSYYTLYNNVKSILPDERIWNDANFDRIYIAAQKNLGIHIG